MTPRITLGLAVLLTSALPASAVEIERMARGQKISMSCDLTAVVAGPGIPDAVTGEKIAAYVRDSEDIRRAVAVPWGHEGELDICLLVPSLHLERVYQEINALIPDYRAYGATGRYNGAAIIRGSSERFR